MDGINFNLNLQEMYSLGLWVGIELSLVPVCARGKLKMVPGKKGLELEWF